MKFFKDKKDKGSRKINALKIKSLVVWNTNNKGLFCLDCGSTPKEFVFLTRYIYQTKFKQRIPSPMGWSFVILRPDRVKLDLLNDVAFRCDRCAKKHHDFHCEKENEAIKIFKTQQELGGDVFDLNPLRGGAWGMGKR